VDGVSYSGFDNKWGAYFKAPENTILKANPKNQIMTRTTVTELVQDGSGRVTGVRGIRFDGTEVEITARMGVVLATGGYGANIKMVMDSNSYWSPAHLTAQIKTTNRSLSQGEGIVMAQKAGAAVTGMGWTQLMPLGWVDNGNLAGGTGENVIYISPGGTPNAGKRYVNEAAERDVLSQGAYDYGGTNGLFIELGNPARAMVSMGGPSSELEDIEGRLYYCTLEEAAALLKIDEEVLRKTITDYDMYIIGASSTPPVPAKSAFWGTIGDCDQDASGKYVPQSYRINTITVRYLAPSTHHTMGGLQVDTERRVLNNAGQPIPGLYAAGEVTGGVFAGNRLGGNAITEIIVSGRIAGNSVIGGK
jgi:fumarate reductase flavoprotein subunit